MADHSGAHNLLSKNFSAKNPYSDTVVAILKTSDEIYDSKIEFNSLTGQYEEISMKSYEGYDL